MEKSCFIHNIHSVHISLLNFLTVIKGPDVPCCFHMFGSINRHNSIDHIGDPLALYVREDKMIIQGTSIESIKNEHNAFPRNHSQWC